MLIFKKTIHRLRFFLSRIINEEIQKVQRSNLVDLEKRDLMIGRLLSNQLSSVPQINCLHDAEFKIFSQMGDDGIIQYLIRKLKIQNKTFIEFGVENYKESNTRFLLMNNNWSGLVIDGSEDNVNQIRRSYYYWRFDLLALHSFITLENIESLITTANFDREIGILSIDIDGNDFWIWKKIDFIEPIIVIIEYNSVFGIDKPWTIPYDPSFIRTNAHKSNLYYGTSLLSLCDLAKSKGYEFIGCNSAGNNSYFIRHDKIGDLKILTPEEGYVSSKLAESRDESGRFSLIRGSKRFELLKSMPVYNTRTNKIEHI